MRRLPGPPRSPAFIFGLLEVICVIVEEERRMGDCPGADFRVCLQTVDPLEQAERLELTSIRRGRLGHSLSHAPHPLADSSTS